MKTVLLAYERDQDLAAVESVMQSHGHRVLKAKTGIEALDVVRNQNPDALVSDVMLPRLDGFALCRRLREDPAFVHLPVLLHSFRVEGPKYEAFAAEVGAQRFFPRGSTLEELVATFDAAPSGSGTMRMPKLVPELLDRREQDRRRLGDLERQLRDVEATNKQLTVAERVARERAEYEARARAEFANARLSKPSRRRAAPRKNPASRSARWRCSKRGSTNCRPRVRACSRPSTTPIAHSRRNPRRRGSSTSTRSSCTWPPIRRRRWSDRMLRPCVASR
jgi:CheY-like chemotaxis protein